MITSLAALMVADRALFPGGATDQAGNTRVSTSDRYNVATNGWTSGPALSAARSRTGSFSFIEQGVVCGGENGTPTEVATVQILTWSTEAFKSGTALSTAVRNHFAFNGATGKGVSIGGYESTGGGTRTAGEKYNLAGDSWAASGSLAGAGRSRGNCGSSSSKGYAMTGCTTDGTSSTGVATVDKYTYSSDTAATGTALGTAASAGILGSLSSTTKAYACHGTDTSFIFTARVQSYKFSDDTTTNTASLGSAYAGECGTSFAGFSMLVGGTTAVTAQTKTDLLLHPSETIVSSTALGTARTRSAGISSNPAWT